MITVHALNPTTGALQRHDYPDATDVEVNDNGHLLVVAVTEVEVPVTGGTRRGPGQLPPPRKEKRQRSLGIHHADHWIRVEFTEPADA